MNCKDVIFHFNKAHLSDPSIPMWVLKAKGETYYVNHVDCNASWSTKETPDNSHTKGSIKVKDCTLIIDEDNNATINKLSLFEKVLVRNQPEPVTRIIFNKYKDYSEPVENALKQSNIKHGPFKTVKGRCGTQYVITELYDKAELAFLTLAAGDKFRILMPNEYLHGMYDDISLGIDYEEEYDE